MMANGHPAKQRQRSGCKCIKASTAGPTAAASLHTFRDDLKGCFAKLQMNNGDYCYICMSVGRVLAKKSKFGLFGAQLFDERNGFEAAMTAKALNYLYPHQRIPADLNNPILCAFTNAALHCSSLPQVSRVFHNAIADAERKSGKAIDKLRFDQDQAAQDFGTGNSDQPVAEGIKENDASV
jgi:hypothetical protein